MPPFSVLLSTYNGDNPSQLEQSLDSIIHQSIVPNEIVVVEDGLLPQSLEQVLVTFELKVKNLVPNCVFQVVKNDRNRGLGHALNDGLKYCSYELVARMDSDDIAKPNRFAKQLKVIEEQPEIQLVGSWVDEFSSDINHISTIRTVPEKPGDIYEYAKKRNPINHPTVMFRKQAVLDAGGYDTTSFSEDYFLWIRMLMNGCKFYNIQESLLFFRYSPETFKRRGGWKYACDEAKVQYRIYKMGFINCLELARNVGIRFTTRILPNKVRKMLYMSALRKKV